jgi:hypothetical protein
MNKLDVLEAILNLNNINNDVDTGETSFDHVIDLANTQLAKLNDIYSELSEELQDDLHIITASTLVYNMLCDTIDLFHTLKEEEGNNGDDSEEHF